MTGYSEPVGTSQPLSRVTIAAMADLGYSVNLGEADAYVPGMSGALSAVPLEPLGWYVVLMGPVRLLPEPERR